MKRDEKYELVVGLEVHAQLQTNSKLFCADATHYGADANTQVSAVSLGHPGTLPVLNEKAVDMAIRLGLALHCEITRIHFFDRKNYFYPDLPKGYQISQHRAPIAQGGCLMISTSQGFKNIALHHMHLEEDAGKSLHDVYPNFTCIDLNRAGVPLLEIVTQPTLHSSEEAHAFLTTLRHLMRWLEVCDGNMEEGSLRCDANISIRLRGTTELGTRVEVKNLNSIRHVKKAIELEFDRMVECMEVGKPIIQETRSFDAERLLTFTLREKEEANDYRYFPEPDLPPFVVTEARLQHIQQHSPLPPQAYKQRFIQHFGLSAYDADQLCTDREEAIFFEKLCSTTTYYKAAANWMLGPIRAYVKSNQLSYATFPLTAESLSFMIQYTEQGQVSFQQATGKWMEDLLKNPEKNPLDAFNALHLAQESDTDLLLQWIEEVFLKFPEKIEDYRAGKKALLGFFAGEVKKRSRGKADMQQVQQLLNEKLKPTTN